MTLLNGQLIDGQHSADNSDTFQAIVAGDDTAFEPHFHEASEAEVGRACEAADAATQAYRSLPLDTRALLLDRIADRLDEQVEAFAQRTPAETGLPEARVRGELGRTTGQLRLFADVVRRGDFLGVRIDTGKPEIRQYRVPIGPVAVFAVSNFPLAFSVAGGDTASALAAGCPVVVKGHPAHPGTAAMTAEQISAALRDLDLPAGIFSFLQGRSHAVGQRLVEHPAIRAVGFTGSFQGGTALARIAASRAEPIPVFAEMGSVNPVFLLPDALTERAEEIAGGFVDSVTLGTGQFCTNPGIVFAASGAATEKFIAAASDRIAEAAPGIMLYAGIREAYDAGIERLNGTSAVQRVASGKAGVNRAQAHLYRTTLSKLQDNPELLDEVFGPTSLIVEIPAETDFATGAKLVPGQLTATIHATPAELPRYQTLIQILEQRAGRLLLNGFPTGVRVCHAMVHGGPFPATTSYGQTTSVGNRAIERFLRLVCYQDFPETTLPPALKDKNPLGLHRLRDGEWQTPG